MFYTEFRPKKFNEIIGNESIVNAITGSLISKKLPHAYFFTGGRGSGKTTTARLIAKAINCITPSINQKDKKFEPCDTCKHCQYLNTGNFADLIELDGASNRGIDKIREITDTVKLSPSSGTHKIYIIDEVHMLTTEASNALLKTLEEPPVHAIFILCTTNPEKVLSTIKSRCIQYKFDVPSVNSLKLKLAKICKAKGINLTDLELEKIAIESRGAFRDAETILEQFALSGLVINDFFSNAGDNIEKFLELFIANDLKNLVLYIDNLNKTGVDLENWTKSILEDLREILLIKLNIKTLSESVSGIKITEDLITNCDAKKLVSLIKLLASTIPEYKTAVYQTMPLELAIIELLAPINEPITNKQVNDTNVNNSNSRAEVVSTKAATIKNSDPELKPKVIQKSVPAIDKILPNKENVNQASQTNVTVDKPQDNKAEPVLGKVITFPYKNLLLELKESQHSTYLTLSSCLFDSFDGKTLVLLATYSFHKERVMSIKTREMIEKVASELIGDVVVLNCKLIDKDEKAKRLTDKNIVNPDNSDTKKPKDIEEVFDSVFGDETVNNKTEAK